MTPTETLLREHRIIERVLACLEKLADAAQAGETLDVSSARDAVRFISEYADKSHHGKEESRLFPAMERHGVPAHMGPTSVMREEHEIGRGEVAGMGDALDALDADRPGAVDAFVRHARNFVLLLVEHIAKEDQVLFPMAAGILPPDEQVSLQAEFERFDSQEIGDDVRAGFETLAEELCERLGVTGPPAMAPTGGCGGGSCVGHG